MKNMLLTIEDKKYLVTMSCQYEGINYYFLMNVEDNKDYKYCYQKDGKLFEILDVDKIMKIAQILSKDFIDKNG